MRIFSLATVFLGLGVMTSGSRRSALPARVVVTRRPGVGYAAQVRTTMGPSSPALVAVGLFTAVLLVAVAPSIATPLHVDAVATMTSGLPFAVSYLPIGTPVTASVDFSVVGGPSTSIFSGGAGTFTWNDGADRTFTVGGVGRGSLAFNGLVGIDFTGTGSTIGTLTATEFSIVFNLGTNPFAHEADQLADLLLRSVVTSFSVGVTENEPSGSLTQFGWLETGVSGSVQTVSVPEPLSLLLVGAGITGLAIARTRRWF